MIDLTKVDWRPIATLPDPLPARFLVSNGKRWITLVEPLPPRQKIQEWPFWSYDIELPTAPREVDKFWEGLNVSEEIPQYRYVTGSWKVSKTVIEAIWSACVKAGGKP